MTTAEYIVTSLTGYLGGCIASLGDELEWCANDDRMKEVKARLEAMEEILEYIQKMKEKV